jgi:CheY-like chemotaxis protein
MGQRLPLRILLAEDHATNQKLALMLLQRLGYRADVAANGLEAVEALERQAYDVVLMDVQMPEMDGLEATRHIRQQWPGEQGPYIVAMTANAMEGDREACLAAGMDDYVSKPIRVEELVGALSRVRPLGERESPNGGNGEMGSAETPPTMEQEADGTGTEQTMIDHQVLDPTALETLQEVVGGEAALLRELIDSFLEETPPLVATLRQALEQGDAAELHRAAHTLKSSSNDFGATTLAELCQELETMGKAGTLDGAVELVTQVEKEYEQARVELEAARDDL